MSNIRPIEDSSRADFHGLRLDNFRNLGIVATTLDGVPYDLVCSFEEIENDGQNIYHDAKPLFIFVNEELFDKLENPAIDKPLDTESAEILGTMYIPK